MPYISSFGIPAKEFIIYLNCTYLCNGQTCTVIELPENSELQAGEGKVRFSDSTIAVVSISDITPIPLEIGNLDSLANATSVDFGTGIKEWTIKFHIPCTIMGDGKFFTYTNPVMQNNMVPPISLNYISDLEATQASFDKDPIANRIYSDLKRGLGD